MGLWNKVKGVFGRIGSGIKKGWNWIRGHKDTITKAIDTASQFVPDKYKSSYDKYKGKAEDYYNKADNIANKLHI